MIRSREELVRECSKAGILFSIESVWNGDVPKSIRYKCEDPRLIFEAFLRHPEGFPSPEELLILWSTNGDSIRGYLKEQEKFIGYYFEDGPENYEIIANTYQEFAAEIVGNAIGMGSLGDQEALELSDFLQLLYLDEVREFVGTNPEWEENVANHIRTIEQGSP